MEIIQERLDREFDMNVITTVPNVSYMIKTPEERWYAFTTRAECLL
jgi:translation elongation factor EF-4